MKELLEQLIINLQEQGTIINELIALEESKFEILKNRDLQELQRVTVREQELIFATDRNDLQRLVCVSRIADALGVSAADLTVLEIARKINTGELAESRSIILHLRDELVRDSMKLNNLNELNNRLLRDNIEFFNYSIALLTGQNLGQATYDPDSTKSRLARRAVLVDREA